jgi:hypothetical protein
MTAIIFKSALFIHVINGFLGLSSGLVAMLSKKGGKLHNRAGLVFYWAMSIVFVTTVLFFVLYPNQTKYHFFLGVGIISFYPNWSGKRLLGMKKAISPTWLDKSMAVAIGIVGLLMFAYALKLDVSKGGDIQVVQILFFVFGSTCLANAYGDGSIYFGFRKPEKLHWLFGHGGKMLGAYTAAVTAFCVNIVPRMLPDNLPSSFQMAVWLTPIIGCSILGQVILKRYRAKVEGPNANRNLA